MIAMNFTYKPLPNCVTIKTSSIDGLGLFAVEDIPNFFHIGCTHHIIQKGIMNSEQAEIIRTPTEAKSSDPESHISVAKKLNFISGKDTPIAEKLRR